jgi:hypothetical protein
MLKTLKPAAGFSISIPGDIWRIRRAKVSTRHDAGPVFEAVAGFLRAVILPNRVKAGSILETGIDIGIAARQIGRAAFW